MQVKAASRGTSYNNMNILNESYLSWRLFNALVYQKKTDTEKYLVVKVKDVYKEFLSQTCQYDKGTFLQTLTHTHSLYRGMGMVLTAYIQRK